jgi:hypothetical protein
VEALSGRNSTLFDEDNEGAFASNIGVLAMLRRFSIDFAIFSIGVDALIIAAALGMATTLRPLFSNLTFIKYIPNPLCTPASLYLVFPLLWVANLASMSVYDGRRNLRF